MPTTPPFPPFHPLTLYYSPYTPYKPAVCLLPPDQEQLQENDLYNYQI
jgi:hypothetical protein